MNSRRADLSGSALLHPIAGRCHPSAATRQELDFVAPLITALSNTLAWNALIRMIDLEREASRS